ncbi:MAG: F0F1 ATP synthase subunit B [Pseudorhodoplanes sp.]|jgi:F-type H+-transporting ATPase subunit b|nr:F0F1 ATP synthase subunit B [Pseudorhodoplanes sp.]
MATNAHTEVPGGGKPQFPPFNKETFASQLVWLAITFVLLYLLMSRLALPRVGGIIQARLGRIEGDLAEAQRLKDETETAMAGYEKTLAEARANAQAIAAKTRDSLMAEAEERRKTLEGRLHQKLEEAEKSIAATKAAAMSNVRSIATEAASNIVERLIGTAPAEKVVADAVADSLKQ